MITLSGVPVGSITTLWPSAKPVGGVVKLIVASPAAIAMLLFAEGWGSPLDDLGP